MAITLHKDKISFGDYELRQGSDGIIFTGNARVLDLNKINVATVSGYTSGGYESPAPFDYVTRNTIDKFSFASDANASDVGDLSVNRHSSAGQSSSEHGYITGGRFGPTPIFTTYNTIDRFPFVSNSNASDVGDLTRRGYVVTGQSSTTNGYTSGGSDPGFTSLNTIDKFPFAASANAADVGDLTQGRQSPAGQSSSTSGYTSGGIGPPRVNVIDKFPFATDSNASDVGDLTQGVYQSCGQSSLSNGYTSGGFSPGFTNVIDRFPFATDASASDVGDMTVSRSAAAGQSSNVSGYTSGGWAAITTPQPPARTNVIDKFPFASNANATDVGDLTQSRSVNTGQQY